MEDSESRRKLRDLLNGVDDFHESQLDRIRQLCCYITRAGLEVPPPEAGMFAPIIAATELGVERSYKRRRTGNSTRISYATNEVEQSEYMEPEYLDEEEDDARNLSGEARLVEHLEDESFEEVDPVEDEEEQRFEDERFEEEQRFEEELFEQERQRNEARLKEEKQRFEEKLQREERERVLEKERLALEREQAELEQRELERRELARREEELREVERKERERLDLERLEEERRELARLEAERREFEKRELEKLELEKREAEKREAEKREAEKREAEKREAEKREAEKREAEKREQEAEERSKEDVPVGPVVSEHVHDETHETPAPELPTKVASTQSLSQSTAKRESGGHTSQFGTSVDDTSRPYYSMVSEQSFAAPSFLDSRVGNTSEHRGPVLSARQFPVQSSPRVSKLIPRPSPMPTPRPTARPISVASPRPISVASPRPILRPASAPTSESASALPEPRAPELASRFASTPRTSGSPLIFDSLKPELTDAKLDSRKPSSVQSSPKADSSEAQPANVSKSPPEVIAKSSPNMTPKLISANLPSAKSPSVQSPSVKSPSVNSPAKTSAKTPARSPAKSPAKTPAKSPSESRVKIAAAPQSTPRRKLSPAPRHSLESSAPAPAVSTRPSAIPHRTSHTNPAEDSKAQSTAFKSERFAANAASPSAFLFGEPPKSLMRSLGRIPRSLQSPGGSPGELRVAGSGTPGFTPIPIPASISGANRATATVAASSVSIASAQQPSESPPIRRRRVKRPAVDIENSDDSLPDMSVVPLK